MSVVDAKHTEKEIKAFFDKYSIPTSPDQYNDKHKIDIDNPFEYRRIPWDSHFTVGSTSNKSN